MFYTDGRNPLTRFWITGKAQQISDKSWKMKCPVMYKDEPLTAFANVIYEIPVIKAPQHRYNGISEMASTSNYAYAWPDELQQTNIKTITKHNRLIDDFSAGLRDWDGSLANPMWWSISTRKISHAQYMGPKGAELFFEINSPKAGMKVGIIAERKFMEANNREHAFYGFFDMPKQGWNTVRIKTSDLKNPFGWQLDDWHKLSRIVIQSAHSLSHQINKDYKRIAGHAAERNKGKAEYRLKLGEVPDKVSGGDEKYYIDAGDAYTKDNMLTKDDVLARTRFRNLRWEGGEYVERTKPYVEEKYVNPNSR